MGFFEEIFFGGGDVGNYNYGPDDYDRYKRAQARYANARSRESNAAYAREKRAEAAAAPTRDAEAARAQRTAERERELAAIHERTAIQESAKTERERLRAEQKKAAAEAQQLKLAAQEQRKHAVRDLLGTAAQISAECEDTAERYAHPAAYPRQASELPFEPSNKEAEFQRIGGMRFPSPRLDATLPMPPNSPWYTETYPTYVQAPEYGEAFFEQMKSEWRPEPEPASSSDLEMPSFLRNRLPNANATPLTSAEDALNRVTWRWAPTDEQIHELVFRDQRLLGPSKAQLAEREYQIREQVRQLHEQRRMELFWERTEAACRQNASQMSRCSKETLAARETILVRTRQLADLYNTHLDRWQAANRSHAKKLRLRQEEIDRYASFYTQLFTEYEAGEEFAVTGFLESIAARALGEYATDGVEIVASWNANTNHLVVDYVLPRFESPRVKVVRAVLESESLVDIKFSRDERDAMARSAAYELPLRIARDLAAFDYACHMAAVTVSGWRAGVAAGDGRMRGVSCNNTLTASRDEIAGYREAAGFMRAIGGSHADDDQTECSPKYTTIEEGSISFGDVTERGAVFFALFALAPIGKNTPAGAGGSQAEDPQRESGTKPEPGAQGDSAVPPPLWWLTPKRT